MELIKKTLKLIKEFEHSQDDHKLQFFYHEGELCIEHKKRINLFYTTKKFLKNEISLLLDNEFSKKDIDVYYQIFIKYFGGELEVFEKDIESMKKFVTFLEQKENNGLT